MPSVVSREYSRIRAGVSVPMQGAARREYRAVLARAATPQWRAYARSRRALPPWPVAALRPLAMGGAIPGGNAPCHKPRGER